MSNSQTTVTTLPIITTHHNITTKSLTTSYMNQYITVLTFTISFVLFISYLYYKTSHHQNASGLIITSFKNIPVKIVSNAASLKLVIHELLSYKPLYLGVDCEWRPNTKHQAIQNKVSVIQIAHKHLIILIRLNKIKNIYDAFISSGLLSLFSNTEIIKCGVGIFQDKKKLFRDYSINIFGCIELNDLYQKYHVNTDNNHCFMGLKTLSKLICNIDMKYKFQDKSVTLSDWATSNNLTEKQIIYAAEDAIVGYDICDKLIKMNIETEAIINSDLIEDICFGIMDLNKSKSFVDKRHSDNCHKNKNKKGKNNKSSYEKYFYEEKETLLYDNCKILKPNGDFLSWCRRKTLDRYINKGFAERVDPRTIKLNFEPENFNKKPSVEVVLGFKKNECCVCGERKKKLMRYFVVPLLYRRFFPLSVNEEAWRRHDMLPLCQMCHLKSQAFNENFKHELCEKYKVKHYRSVDNKLVKQCKLMKAIKPLMNENVSRNIPKGRKIILLEQVAKHFNMEYEVIEDGKYDESDDLLFGHLVKISDKNGGNKGFVNKMKLCYDESINNKINIGKTASEKHSKNMIKVFENNVVEFIKLWRQQFVDNMKPKYLPRYWSIGNTFFDLSNNKSESSKL